MAFALSGALGIKCQRCQGAPLIGRWWIADSERPSPRRLLSSFLSHVPTAALPGRSKTNAITHKSIYNGLIMQKIQLFLYSLCVDYKGLLDVFVLLRLIKSTWGWKLYVARLRTVLHMRPFIQAGSNVPLSLRIWTNAYPAHVVFSFRPDWEPPTSWGNTMSQVGGSECGDSQHGLDK